MEQTNTEDFQARLKGKFYGMLQWKDLDALWARVKTGQWYFYQIGEELPVSPLGGAELATRIDALDKLLHDDHNYHLCGIVYADHIEQPTLIKVYDPNSLGSSCSKSATPPRWILCTEQPPHVENHAPTPENRRRWWQMFQSA